MRTLSLALLLACAVACDEPDLTGASTVTGAYTLRTVNGAGLPFAYAASPTEKIEYLDDIMTLFQGGTYARTSHKRRTLNGQITPVDSSEGGTFLAFGTSITFRFEGTGPARVAIANGKTMTFIEQGNTQVYRK